ncbi:VTS1 [Candida metapsilosis]|uniref:RNA-binding protein VTS1 n=1 Tax=Candida metapsilosis TaxID=273372 RepID=A0A8H8DE44_9ASCO|nr:VTS1 [Candida metapsilosis]
MDQSEPKQTSLASSSNAPIVLSPPPLEHTQSNNLLSNQSEFPSSQRQQSVGYNLQHEFENLTAELDLDLKNQRASQSVPPYNRDQVQSTPSSNLVAPAVSNNATISSNLLNLGTSAPDMMSSTPQLAASNPQLSSLLENRVQSSQPTGGFLHPPSVSIPDRPQSAHDFTNIFRRTGPGLTKGVTPFQQSNQSNLYSDLLVFSNWIENLSPQDTVSMIDYLCASLPVDVLLTFQAKLDHHLQAYNQPNVMQNPLSPYGTTAFNSELDMESLSLNDRKLNQTSAQKTGTYNTDASAFNPSLSNIEITRPRSADPFLQKNQQGFANPERSKSPTSHLHEKTNFLQLAANNNVSPYYYSNSPYYSQQLNNSTSGLHQDENLDMSSTALKLGALATINSRVALDSNRKHPHGGAQWNTISQQHHQHGGHHHHTLQHPQVSPHDKLNLAMGFENSINRGANSASVPANSHYRNNYNVSAKRKVTSPTASNMQHSNMSNSSVNNQTGTNASSSSSSSSSMPSEVASIELLNNIPAWLKLLRLHKYTDCLKDIYWKDLIELNNEQLEEKGVAALGARRKLLKAFEAVKNSQR